MVTVLRHLLAVVLLPFMVVVVVPRWLLTAFAHHDSRWSPSSPLRWPPHLFGVAVFCGGLLLFAWCLALFARVGRGTLAPWDPTQRLVAVGPYQYLRNPMISGVLAMLAGLSIMFSSWVIALWAAVFLILNHLYFRVLEEPGLERRFGESYRIYRANVPRWLPRATPWRG